jgi:hypothetical protein
MKWSQNQFWRVEVKIFLYQALPYYIRTVEVKPKIKTLWNEIFLARTSYNPLFTSLLITTMMNQFPPSRVLESLHSNDIASSNSQSHEFLSFGKTIFDFFFIAQKFQYTWHVCVCVNSLWFFCVLSLSSFLVSIDTVKI